MFRKSLKTDLDNDPHFTWRGNNVTRLENLSDIVFALGLGMVVSASITPETFSDLGTHFLSIFPVAAAFAILLQLWNAHYVFFRRYGLGDGRTIFLNACLLLVVLFFAYPLRFVFDGLFGFIYAVLGYPATILKMGIGGQQAAIMVSYFAIGYGLAFGLIGLMYNNALAHRRVLKLSTNEIIMTKRTIGANIIRVLCAALVVGFAMLTPLSAFSGFLLFLFFPLRAILKKKYKLQHTDTAQN